MRPDGDPERDDYGLPHVDVVIPDDARELDRDVIAYRREARQRRRRAMLRRIFRPFSRYGPAVPLIAGALLVAVISGVLITVLGPRPGTHLISPTTAPSSTPQAGQTGSPLPAGAIKIDNRDAKITDLQGAIVMLAPDGCQCDKAVQSLTRQAHQYDLKAFLVGSHQWTQATAPELSRMAGQPGAIAQVVKDEAGILSSTYRASGLTILLVHIDGIISEIQRNVPTDGVQFSPETLNSLTAQGQNPPSSHGPNATPGH